MGFLVHHLSLVPSTVMVLKSSVFAKLSEGMGLMMGILEPKWFGLTTIIAELRNVLLVSNLVDSG